MLALTIGGQAGAGGPEIGHFLARSLPARYIQHLAVRRLARCLNATVDAVSRKELSFSSRRTRVVDLLELLVERLGRYGSDPVGFPGLPLYAQAPPSLRTHPAEITDAEYVKAVYDTAAKFAQEGDLVLVERAGAVTLRRFPQIIHVGLFASRHARVMRMSRRLGVGYLDANAAVSALDAARRAWYEKLGGADPADPAIYDMRFHTDFGEEDGDVARRIIDESLDMRFGTRAAALTPA
jgi:cytidylate kinase